MTNLLLAPEEDDSDLAHNRSLGVSSQDNTSDSMERSELQKFHISFDLQKSGFGIRPWPGVDATSASQSRIAVATKYLRDGIDERNQGESE